MFRQAFLNWVGCMCTTRDTTSIVMVTLYLKQQQDKRKYFACIYVPSLAGFSQLFESFVAFLSPHHSCILNVFSPCRHHDNVAFLIVKEDSVFPFVALVKLVRSNGLILSWITLPQRHQNIVLILLRVRTVYQYID